MICLSTIVKSPYLQKRLPTTYLPWFMFLQQPQDLSSILSGNLSELPTNDDEKYSTTEEIPETFSKTPSTQ